MPCINLNDVDAINNLQENDFAYPCLNWDTEIPQIFGQLASLKKIHTVINNRLGDLPNYYGQNLLEYFTGNEALNENSYQTIENQITNLITQFLAEHDYVLTADQILNQHNTNTLKVIAIGIQLWGGITGRGIFIFKNGFNNNFNPGHYVLMIRELIQGNSIAAVKAVTQIPYIGVAFGTKHCAFWSRALHLHNNQNGNNHAITPIYDANIAAVLYGRKGLLTLNQYDQYINNDLPNALNEIYAHNPDVNPTNFNAFNFERLIFNFSNCVYGKAWRMIRTREQDL